MKDHGPLSEEERAFAAGIAPSVDADDSTPPSPAQIVAALLFVGGLPLTSQRAREIIRGLTDTQFSAIIDELNHDYRQQGRPYLIQPRSDGFVMALRSPFQQVVEKLHGGVREARLSAPAVDVLALVAYRQPVGKSDIDNVRGAESGSILRQLVRRGLIQVLPRQPQEPIEILYGTTPRFLEMFALNSLDDLPQTQDLQQI